MAPELFTQKFVDASPAIDIWSLGCILFAMVFGKLPFASEKPAGIKKRIVDEPLKFPDEPQASEEVKNLLERILDKNPDTRAVMFEIREHAWMIGRSFTQEEKDALKQKEEALKAKLELEKEKEKEKAAEEVSRAEVRKSMSPVKKYRSNLPSSSKKVSSSISPEKKHLSKYSRAQPKSKGSIHLRKSSDTNQTYSTSEEDDKKKVNQSLDRPSRYNPSRPESLFKKNIEERKGSNN